METAAVDVGSSFTDVIRRDASGRLTFAKLPSESADPAAPVLAAAGAGALRHGTTLGLNALLQRKGARVGLIVTKGFRDVLNLGRQSRRELYAMPPRAATPDFLVAETLRAEIDERIDAEGRVVTPLDDAEAARVIRRLVADGAEALAIGLLFAFRNPIHEHRLAAIAAGMFPGLPVSESHEVDPLPREFERIAATACDAFLRPTMGGYLRRLARPDLHVMRSSGGLIDGAEAARQPARLLLSGPAAAALRAAEAARAAGCPDALSIDVGGASADIALIEGGRPRLRDDLELGDVPLRLPAVDVHSLGVAGSSVVRVERGRLRIGPESAGGRPGPACFGLGGRAATPTDAALIAGRLAADGFAGGAIKLDRAAAEAALAPIAGGLGIDLAAAATAILDLAETLLAEATRLVAVRRGLDPRRLGLVALGGAGPLHAAGIAARLGIERVLIPARPGLGAAAGLLAAPIEIDTIDSPMQLLDNRSMARWADGAGVERIVTLSEPDRVDGLDLTIGANETAAALAARFREACRRQFGHAGDASPMVLRLRRVERIASPQVAIDDLPFPSREGPAAMARADCAIWIPSGWRLRPSPGQGAWLERAR